MSSSFPTELDSFLSIADNPAMNTSGRTATQVVGQLQAALAAVQAVIGVTGSSVSGTVEKRISDQAAAISALSAALGAPVIVSGTAPASPQSGAAWLDTSASPAALKVWVAGSPGTWVTVGGSGGATVSGTAPSSPANGALWLDTSTTPSSLKVWVTGSPGAWAQIGVLSVNGRTGAVVLTDSDVPATVVTETGTSRSLTNSDAGTYIRFTSTSAKTVTFGTGLNVTGQEFHLRNVGTNNLTLAASGTTLNAPAGGTLVVPPGGTVTVKQVASTTFDVFGTTTAA